MAQFPPMMSAENPYLRGLGGGGGDAGLEFVSRLRAAAAQQQQLQQHQAQQQFNNELDMRKAGYEPYLENTGPANIAPTQGVGGKQLQTRQPQTGAASSDVITDPFGGKWVKKAATPAVKPEATPQQTFSDTTALLEHGATPLDFTPVPGTHPNAVSPPGSGGRYYDVPTDDQKAATETRHKVDQAAALRQLVDMEIPDEINQKLGLKPGGRATLRDILEAHSKLNAPDKPERPDATSIVPGVTGGKGGLVVFDKNTQSTSEVPLPRGAKRELTPAQMDANQRRDQAAADRNQATVERLQDKQAKLSSDAEEYRQLAQQYGSQIGAVDKDKAKDGETGTYIDPMDKSRKARPMTVAARTSLGQSYMKWKMKADELDKQAAGIGKQIEGRQPKTPPADAAPAPAGGPPQRTQQTPGPPQAPFVAGQERSMGTPEAKVANVDHLRQYAKQKNISLPQAIREFQDAGYTIQR